MRLRPAGCSLWPSDVSAAFGQLGWQLTARRPAQRKAVSAAAGEAEVAAEQPDHRSIQAALGQCWWQAATQAGAASCAIRAFGTYVSLTVSHC